MLSIVIPSRQPEFLQKTIDDLLAKAEGEVEVIVCFDGVWPEKPLRDNPQVVIFHHGEVHDNVGMRGSINAGMSLARGDYVMKCDDHTMVGQGYDRILVADCEDGWVVIPRRKRLDPERWELIEDGRPPVDYMYVEYPYLKPYDKTQGLHGAEWRRPERAEIMIDDTPTMQGSGYFMKKKTWETLFPNGLDDESYGNFTQEAQEITNKAWLSGGRVIVNKNTWYAHFHKGRKGKGYGFSREQYKKHLIGTEKGRLHSINHWLSTKDYKYDWNWFVTEKFPDMPGWSKYWQERVARDKDTDFSKTYGKEGYKPEW
jgi:glycosyltransferase involved in cell wall biosynthesis